jgi:hypothetical protein
MLHIAITAMPFYVTLTAQMRDLVAPQRIGRAITSLYLFGLSGAFLAQWLTGLLIGVTAQAGRSVLPSDTAWCSGSSRWSCWPGCWFTGAPAKSSRPERLGFAVLRPVVNLVSPDRVACPAARPARAVLRGLIPRCVAPADEDPARCARSDRRRALRPDVASGTKHWKTICQHG